MKFKVFDVLENGKDDALVVFNISEAFGYRVAKISDLRSQNLSMTEDFLALKHYRRAMNFFDFMRQQYRIRET